MSAESFPNSCQGNSYKIRQQSFYTISPKNMKKYPDNFFHHGKIEFHHLSNEITKFTSAQKEPPAANFPTPMHLITKGDQLALALPKPSSKIAKQVKFASKNPTKTTIYPDN